MGVANENVPLALMERLSPPLSWSTRPVPASPLTVPPMVYVFVAQLTLTLVTLAAPTVPVPPDTLHVCEGEDGCARIVTA